MPFVDFTGEALGTRGAYWPVAGFTVRGTPSVEIRNTPPPGAHGVTSHDELLIDLPAPATEVLVNLIVGNGITVEALDGGGAVVRSTSFPAATGTTAVVLTSANPPIQTIRMRNSGTEDRITLVFSS
jgi:hypothetical protein